MTTAREKTMKTICVYCASSNGLDAVYVDAARALGTLLGKSGRQMVNGAGHIGLMRVVSDAALAAGGSVTGVIPRFLIDREVCHPGLTQCIAVDTMHERKQQMAELSDAAIALPGGCGTMEELLEVITWKNLGIYHQPIVILNINGYYDALITLLHRAVAERFMSPHVAGRPLWLIADTPEQALALIEAEWRAAEDNH